MSNLYWLTEEQMARLRPYFPKSHGKPRVDDRRGLSGIVFVNRNGLRWCDAPKDYGPHKTLYNRWKRWGEKGIFLQMMEGLAAASAEPKSSMPISVQASGVLEAPAKMATKPSAAKRSVGAPSGPDKALPRPAPMKNRGVTSPPLKPVARVATVKTIFQAQAHGKTWFPKNATIDAACGSGEVTPRPR